MGLGDIIYDIFSDTTSSGVVIFTIYYIYQILIKY